MQGVTISFIAVIGVMLLLLLGDYLGYKLGRRRLAAIAGAIALVAVVAFAIYAAIYNLT
jgi:hypothetical protein